MLLVTTTLVVGILSTLASADPQPQPQPQPPGARPIYITPGQGQIPRQPQQFQPSPQFNPGPPAPHPSSYQRPPNNYIINSTPKPISHQQQQQLPSPSPVPSPARQQLSSPSRPIPSAGPQSSSSSNRYSSSLGEVQPVYGNSPSYVPQQPPNRNRYQPSPQQQSKYSSQLKNGQAQGSKQNQLTSEEQAEYEEELEQEPDRLTLLLAESKFKCDGKKDGYYADTGLQCEVFHYCNAGAKHSWMCPNNFAFHQVHLICVPPSSDDICKQSESFHFVNEYLYRPINEKEAQATNTSLKYADRYYPDGYTPGTPLDEMVANYDSSHQHHPEPRAPHAFKQQQHRSPPPAYHGSNANGGDRNVFYSPESINIPLSQRRPQQSHRAGPSSQGSSSSSAKSPAQQSPKNYNKYEDEEYEDEY